ncbi:MAG: hypothetical protein WDA16_14730 [Candidatus Thermoplasmatota archaeon]
MAQDVGWGNVPQRVMMHLLKERATFGSVRELARQLGVGHSKVAEVVNFLVFHRALRVADAGFVVEWEQLARIMAALRLPAIVPARTIDLPIPQAEFHDRLRDAEISHVFGFTTAANALAYFEPHPEVCVLIAKPDMSRVARLLDEVAIAHEHRRGRVSSEASRSQARVLLFADKLDRLDVVDAKIGVVTSLHQTYVDILHFPLAGAHADFLKKAIEKRWARDHPETASPRARSA